MMPLISCLLLIRSKSFPFATEFSPVFAFLFPNNNYIVSFTLVECHILNDLDLVIGKVNSSRRAHYAKLEKIPHSVYICFSQLRFNGRRNGEIIFMCFETFSIIQRGRPIIIRFFMAIPTSK